MAERARESQPYDVADGVPLSVLVWDPTTAMDRSLIEADQYDVCGECFSPEGCCDHTIRYSPVESETNDGR